MSGVETIQVKVTKPCFTNFKPKYNSYTNKRKKRKEKKKGGGKKKKDKKKI